MAMKLGKLKMPMKPSDKKKPADEMDPGSLGFAGEDDMEADADASNELAGESEGESEDESAPADEFEDSSELSSIPDEDLLAEVKKRGLSKKLGMAAPAAARSSAVPSADDSTEF